MGTRKARKGETNSAFLDRYSLFHLAAGAILADQGASASMTLFIAAGFELTENTLKDNLPRMFPAQTHDAPINMLGDVLSTMLGWGLMQRFARKTQGSQAAKPLRGGRS